jgi:hypothetical protein
VLSGDATGCVASDTGMSIPPADDSMRGGSAMSRLLKASMASRENSVGNGGTKSGDGSGGRSKADGARAVMAGAMSGAA